MSGSLTLLRKVRFGESNVPIKGQRAMLDAGLTTDQAGCKPTNKRQIKPQDIGVRFQIFVIDLFPKDLLIFILCLYVVQAGSHSLCSQG